MNPINLLTDLPAHLPAELVTTLLDTADVRIERIISHGHASPADFWYDQPQAEWVIVLKGAARLQFEDGMVEMKVGDFLRGTDKTSYLCRFQGISGVLSGPLNIPAFKRHRVDWTTPDVPTVWLGVRYGDQGELK